MQTENMSEKRYIVKIEKQNKKLTQKSCAECIIVVEIFCVI